MKAEEINWESEIFAKHTLRAHEPYNLTYEKDAEQ